MVFARWQSPRPLTLSRSISMTTYSILSSRDHNSHYLLRYLKFIKYCSEINHNLPKPYEKHHICPKSKCLFPEYSDFKVYPWNLIILTPRQHFIAHWILWKTYGKGQTEAFFKMNQKQPGNKTQYTRVNSKIYAKLRMEKSIKTSKQMRENNPSCRPEVKVLRRLAKLGSKHTKETIDKIKKSKEFTSEETRNKMSISHLGVPTSDNQKLSVAIANSKRKGTNPLKAAIEKNKIKCSCDGVIYDSITEAQSHYPGVKVSNRLKSLKYPTFYRIIVLRDTTI